MDPTKKMIRSNKEQINYLCRYMMEHPEFAAGDYRSAQGAHQLAEEWVRLKQALDELGPQRTVEQWKVCWRDQKRKARGEGGEHRRATMSTGNAAPVPALSDNAVLVLNAIGPEMAIGMGPEESPIGYTQPQQPDQPIPSPTPTASTRRVRRRRVLPHESFINAQQELNLLMRELIAEVRRSNDLREQHLNHLLRRSRSPTNDNA